MKFLVCSLLLMAMSIIALSQNNGGEEVDWDHALLFSAKTLVLKTEDQDVRCEGCRIFEISTASGVTGIFIMGKGRFSIKSKHISDDFSSCMIRFNPAEYHSLVQFEGLKPIEDAGFKAEAQTMLSNMFRHCYHSGMNALIPERGDYTINYNAKKYGDLLAGRTPDKEFVYSFTEKKEY